jgi:hypothetical protein
MNTQLPARPDIAPKKKRHVGLIVLAVIGGLILLGSLTEATEEPTMTTTTPSIDEPVGDTGFEITPEFLVDTMGSKQVEAFCTGYIGVADHDLALSSFAEGYGTDQDPSAEEVFDELLSRC